VYLHSICGMCGRSLWPPEWMVTGKFALLLSRHLMDDTANWICREQWAQHSKMIIGMDDDDVLQMIATKQADGEPTDMVRQKVEDFRLRM